LDSDVTASLAKAYSLLIFNLRLKPEVKNIELFDPQPDVIFFILVMIS